jgi:hypothetical protein
MSDENLSEVQEEIDEPPMTPDELLANLMQDLILDNEPNDLAREFVDEFVCCGDRPETPQILAMLEMPTESLIGMMKGFLETSYQRQLQAVDNHGVRYFENLKAAVKAQMLEVAEQ